VGEEGVGGAGGEAVLVAGAKHDAEAVAARALEDAHALLAEVAVVREDDAGGDAEQPGVAAGGGADDVVFDAGEDRGPRELVGRDAPQQGLQLGFGALEEQGEGGRVLADRAGDAGEQAGAQLGRGGERGDPEGEQVQGLAELVVGVAAARAAVEVRVLACPRDRSMRARSSRWGVIRAPCWRGRGRSGAS
jgi:hypothetical protein